uniref:Uncharacterized protein n=1 Tax=Vitis vinifera TaxID=29760 RepID=A5C123_VITVI|nr:hypothetical protein VITISV_005746 [Vitis vinifera]
MAKFRTMKKISLRNWSFDMMQLSSEAPPSIGMLELVHKLIKTCKLATKWLKPITKDLNELIGLNEYDYYLKEMSAIHAHQEQILATQTQHTAILRQLQHHLGLPSVAEHLTPTTAVPHSGGHHRCISSTGHYYCLIISLLLSLHIILEFHPDAATSPGCITSGILLRRHSTRMSHIWNSGRVTFNILQIFRIRRLTPDGRGGRFNFSRYTYPDPLIVFTRRVLAAILHSADSAHPESFAAHFAQCHGVLLKLPDMCDRHFEIFFSQCRCVLLKLPDMCDRHL